jgi:hypothetical protein
MVAPGQADGSERFFLAPYVLLAQYLRTPLVLAGEHTASIRFSLADYGGK